jgi:MinD-like ATPase involved in chromosome partitioning or flagellar assembly
MNPRVVLAVAGERGDRLAAELERAGARIDRVIDPLALEDPNLASALPVLEDVDVLVLAADRRTLGSHLVSVCDRRGIRIVALAGDADGERVAAAFGLAASLVAPRVEEILAAIRGASWNETPAASATVGRVIVVWGPDGAPGRTTVASMLAFELARGGRGAALIDADSHAPALALALGLADEGPGFPAACRQAGLGTLDERELSRISTPVRVDGAAVDVLCGINRRGRWHELAADRVTGALEAARRWAAYTVVDVAAPVEQDEELMHDLEGPRRNAATIGALRCADVIVAVCSADPIGVARFLRGYAEVRAIAGATPVVVVANRLRPGGLGLDARGQIRRTLDRLAGIREVAFLPADQRAVDAAVLQAQSVSAVAPRSALVAAVRRFTGDTLLPVLGRIGASPGSRDVTDGGDGPSRRPSPFPWVRRSGTHGRANGRANGRADGRENRLTA